uniref:MoaB/Mog domain-containing protein n=1 Tax=Plectus sambesii TaxID=2011161 RepID=A0A914WK81_9BILA
MVEPVASRRRESPWPLLSMDESLAIVARESPVLETLTCSTWGSMIGHIIAEDVHAAEPHPAFPASIKDGYAVITSDGGGIRHVVGVTTAGHTGGSIELQPSTCARVSTGSFVPLGADAVVQVEDTKLVEQKDGEEISIEITIPPTLGQDIRPIGSDIAQGELVIPKGCLIGSSEIGILASVGRTSVSVIRKPKIGVLSTGNEVVDDAPINELPFGKVRDSNRPELLALFASLGYEALNCGIATDELADTKNKLMAALQSCDVIVSSGGVSMGEKDLLKYVLEKELNFTIHFGRVMMKPGKPTTFATGMYEGRKKLVFALPGNPVSAWVTAHIYVVPSIRRMSGHSMPDATILRVKLTSDVKKLDPRPEYMRAWLSSPPAGSDIPLAVMTGSNQMSSRLTSTRGANLLLKIPPKSANVTSLKTGDVVDAMVIGAL